MPPITQPPGPTGPRNKAPAVQRTGEPDMMNANTDPREPMADASGPKPEAEAPRRRQAAAKATTSATADAGPAADASARRARRPRKPAGDAAPDPAAVTPVGATSAPRRAGRRTSAKAVSSAPAPAKPRGRRRATVEAPAPLAPAAAGTVPVVEPAPVVEPVAVVAKEARTVRETVKLTEGDVAALGHLSARAGTLGRKARKSTLVRAAIRALAAMDDAGLAAALDAPVPALLAVVGARRRKAN